jgi:hypothetical protein
MPRESSAVYAKNQFVASSLVVAKCDCGCGNTKLLLLDENDMIRATATAEPDWLIEAATHAKGQEPMRLERPT